MKHLLSPQLNNKFNFHYKPLKQTAWAMNLITTNKIDLKFKKKGGGERMMPVIQNMTFLKQNILRINFRICSPLF